MTSLRNDGFFPGKKRLIHAEHRYNTNPPCEPLRIQTKVKESLRKTLNMLSSSLLDFQSFENNVHKKEVVDMFFEEFSKEVHIDMIHLKAERMGDGFAGIITQGQSKQIPQHLFHTDISYHSNERSRTDVKRVINKGLNAKNTSQYPGLYKILTSQETPKHVMILVHVNNYMMSDPPSGAHLICGFKHMDTLYCFNAWGEEYKRNQESLPDDTVWERLRVTYKCKKSIIYTGYNFQQANAQGACVGYGNNFGTHMYNYILTWQFMHIFKINKIFTLRYQNIPNIVQVNRIFNFNSPVLPNMYYSVRFNHFVMDLFTYYEGMFGKNRINLYNPSTSAMIVFKGLTQNINVTKEIRANERGNNRRKTPQLQNLNNVNYSSIVYDTIIKSTDPSNISEESNKFVTNMRKSKWMVNNNNMSDNQRVVRNGAQLNVVRYIRANNNRLKNLNTNSIKELIYSYMKSGNLHTF
jgi:hypothetical protein